MLTSPFGDRISPFTNSADFHAGIDLAAREGTPILATGSGRVVFAGRFPLDRNVRWWRYDVGSEERTPLWGVSTVRASDSDRTVSLNSLAMLTVSADGSEVAGILSGDDLAIRLTKEDTTTFFGFDEVTLTYAPIPEPSATALLGLGGLALLRRRRK